MKIQSLYAVLVFAFALTATPAIADTSKDSDDKSEDTTVVTESENGSVKITWIKPEDYRDVRESNRVGSRKKYRAFVFKTVQEHMEKLAEGLPEGYSMEMTVKDVDLAGDTRTGNVTFNDPLMQDVRVLQDIHFPMMDFTYVVKDQDGQVLKQDDVKVKDMNYLRRGRVAIQFKPLDYEKRMLRDWFRSEFKELKVDS